MLVHIRQTQTSWQTITVSTEKEAMRKIKERYPKAANAPWEIDLNGLIPVGRSMRVYADRKALQSRNTRLVARIRK